MQRFDKHDQIILTNVLKTLHTLALPWMLYSYPWVYLLLNESCKYNIEFYLTATFEAGSHAIYFLIMHIICMSRQEDF